jgi:uncharacterized protein YciW
MEERVLRVDLSRCGRAAPSPAPESPSDVLQRIKLGMDAMRSGELHRSMVSVFVRVRAESQTPHASSAPVRITGVKLARSASAPVVQAAVVPAPQLPPQPPPPLPARCQSQQSRLMFRCVLCGLATSSELEPTVDGDRFVHTRCGSVQTITNTIAGSGDDSRKSLEEDPARKSARADQFASSSAPFYATMKERVQSELGSRADPTKRGLGRAQARVDAMAVRENSLLTSFEASKLRSAIDYIEKLLQESVASDPELRSESQKIVQDTFVEAARVKRMGELTKIASAAAAVAAIKIATEQRLGDHNRRKSPVFQKARTSFVTNVPESSGVSPVHLEQATMLVEQLLGFSPKRRVPSRAAADEEEDESDQLFCQP